MRFSRIRVENFRAIQLFEAENLADLVVISGPNGCGKSCVFDALRLLKSSYGGYQANERIQWFSEFQLDLSSPQGSVVKTIRVKSESAEIRATLEISKSESAFLKENMGRLCTTRAWAAILGRQLEDLGGYTPEGLALQHPYQVPAVEQLAHQMSVDVVSELEASSVFDIGLSINPDGHITQTECIVAEIIFQTYEPGDLGVLDYHSASRSYQREALGGLNLDPRALLNNRKGMALYNAANKYQGVKGEIVNSYVQSLVSQAADPNAEAGANDPDLSETLGELFRTFFPDKSFSGVRPRVDGTVELPVTIASGGEHDINELSSGEKEILFGYLRLRNDTPHHSVILLDEPELHLNPRLVADLPDFYYRNLCIPFDNQIWMVTHSDALLRHAVVNPKFSVLHMMSATTIDSRMNQAVAVADDGLDAAILALVGDISAYRPAAKIVVLEGGGASNFDKTVIQRLFPDVAAKVNLVSGGSKGGVRGIYETLSTEEQGEFAGRLFAIVDRDFDSRDAATDVPQSHFYTWDVYHIENYLLVPKYLVRAIRSLDLHQQSPTETEMADALLDCARAGLDSLVATRLAAVVNQRIVASVSVRCAPDSRAPGQDLLPSIRATYSRLDALRSQLEDLSVTESDIRSDLERHIADGSHLTAFPGREIIKRLLGRFDVPVGYEGFVSLVINEMARDGFRPGGMSAVLQRIVPAEFGNSEDPSPDQ